MDNSIVIGKGMVGNATMHALGIKDYVSQYGGTASLSEISKFKYIFLCLPTPTIGGKCFTDIIEGYVENVSKDKKDNIFIIRSTVTPGTCRKIAEKYNAKIVHYPEFLTEATWKQDSEWPDIMVIGADDRKLGNEITGLLKSRYKGAEFFQTDTITSEFIKYAINTFYATKVVFGNQIYDYAKEIGANYETVRKVMYARKWIGKNHLKIWHDNKRGAGGKCLQKDLESFSNLSGLPLLKIANELNKKYLDENK